MFNNHLMKACLAAVFAIGLAACSSSDNGTDTSQMPTDPAADGDRAGSWMISRTRSRLCARSWNARHEDVHDLGRQHHASCTNTLRLASLSG